MYYSAIGVLAALILIIENQDVLVDTRKSFDKPAWTVYRRFLFTVLAYYITDILWGILESRKLAEYVAARADDPKKDKIVVASAYTKRVLVKYGKLNVVTLEELAASCL